MDWIFIGVAAIRDAGIAKVLQPAISAYGDKFIIQIQAILLAKSLLKDESKCFFLKKNETVLLK
jgi:hypothetical protein